MVFYSYLWDNQDTETLNSFVNIDSTSDSEKKPESWNSIEEYIKNKLYESHETNQTMFSLSIVNVLHSKGWILMQMWRDRLNVRLCFHVYLKYSLICTIITSNFILCILITEKDWNSRSCISLSFEETAAPVDVREVHFFWTNMWLKGPNSVFL